MKCVTHFSWLRLLVVALCCLWGSGCRQGTAPAGSGDQAAEDVNSADADTATESDDVQDEGDDESGQTVEVPNPEAAAIEALEQAGAVVKKNEAGAAVAVEMPRQVSAENWDQLRQLAALEELNLSWSHVRELGALVDLKALKRLDISWTKYVSDEQVDDLVKASQLELLVVEGTDLSDEALQRLRETLDSTQVRVDSDVALSGLPVPQKEEPAEPDNKPEGKYSVGDQAPDIAGKDAEGQEFKLSDYRGKVVMLDFYGNWCPPCRAMYPHNRELMEKYKDREFVLLGVNSDPELGTLVRSMEDDKVTWRSWWDGNNGPIASDWEIPFWPSIFVIDQEGVIRYKRASTDSMEEIATGITGTIDRLLETQPAAQEGGQPEAADAPPDLPAK